MIAAMCFFTMGKPDVSALEDPENRIKVLTFSHVHSGPTSRCDLCHPPTLDPEDSYFFLKSDLCTSCHEDVVVRAPKSRFSALCAPNIMNNHPIKFSPLNYDLQKFNQNVVQEGKKFFIAGQGEKLPLFGESAQKALVECATCHESHGYGGFKKLLRVDNRGSRLCLVCHLDF